MAEVPGASYQPFPTERSQTEHIRMKGVPMVPDAFGKNVGDALTNFGYDEEHAGRSFLEASKELAQRAFAIQSLRNETDARNTANQSTEEMALAQDKFDTLSGAASHDGLPVHLANLNTIRQKYRDTLGPAAAVMYDAESSSVLNRFVTSSAARAGSQLKTYNLQTTKAGIDLLKSAPIDPGDEKALNDKVNAIKVKYEKEYDPSLTGWSPEERDMYMSRDVSAAYKEYANTLDSASPWQAEKFIQVHKNEFRDHDYQLALDHARDSQHTVGGALISDAANQGGRGVAGVPGVFTEQVKQLEGFDPVARWDVKQWTVGYGTRAKFQGEHLTPSEADLRFEQEFAKSVEAVNNVNSNLTPGTLAAMASLTYNTGTSWVNQPLGKAIASGDEGRAKQLFSQYINVLGVPSKAIADRRAQELSWWGKTELSEKPLTQRVQVARDLAHQLSPNDPIMEQHAVAATERGFNQQKAAEYDDNFRSSQTLYEALSGRGTGKLPTTMQEIMSDPKAAEAYFHLREDQKNKVMSALVHNVNAGKITWDTGGVRLARFQELYGMAKTNPEEFLKVDLPNEEIPMAEKLSLIRMRENINAKSEEDPHIQGAMRAMRDAFGTSIPSPTKSPTAFYRFEGETRIWLKDYLNVHKKPPSDDEVKTFGRSLLKEHYEGLSGKLWIGTMGFQRVPTSDWMQKKRQEIPNVSDKELQIIWAAEQAIEEFNKVHPSSTPTAGPAAGLSPPISR